MTAKDAYNAYASELGILAAWERLSDAEQHAWQKVVAEFDTEAVYCPECDRPLECPNVRCMR